MGGVTKQGNGIVYANIHKENKMKKKLYLGDCLEILPTLPANRIDTCITDCPYELGFMGKKWDGSGVSFQKETWEEVYRVLKPGGFLLAFGGTRTWHRIAVAIEDAGFEIRDTICWLYAQGFPKSYNIGKGIDKKAGKEREVIGVRQGHENFVGRETHSLNSGWDRPWAKDPEAVAKYHSETAPATPEAELWEGYGTALKPSFEPIIVAMKPIDETYVNNALTHGVAGLWIDGGRIGTEQTVTTIKDLSQAHGNQFGKAGIEYPKLGEKVNPPGRWPANSILDEESAQMLDEQTGILKSGKDVNPTKKSVKGFFGQDMSYYSSNANYGDNGGASRFFYQAKANKTERNMGLGSCEIVMVQLSHNSQTNERDDIWENGDLNLKLLVDMDQSREKVIDASMSMEDIEWNTLLCGNKIMELSPKDIVFTTLTGTSSITKSKIFNSLMHLLTNEYTQDVKFEKVNGGNPAANVDQCNIFLNFISEKMVFLPGVGNVASGTRWTISASEKSANDNEIGQFTNFHSTVKPLALMKYLARITKTPTGGIVIDPFMGSGTTGMACALEDRNFIGIEMDEEYYQIARLRIEYAQENVDELLTKYK